MCKSSYIVITFNTIYGTRSLEENRNTIFKDSLDWIRLEQCTFLQYGSKFYEE